jgi:hypothetical protein
MADGADAISKGFEIVHPNSPRAMCYSHVLQNAKGYFGCASKNKDRVAVKDAFLDDVASIHSAWTVEVKHSALQLFQSKWMAISNEPDKEYLKHILETFLQSWVNNPRTNRWSVCDVPFGCVTNNNGLEATNKLLKDEITDHRLMGLIAFCKGVASWLYGESKSRNPDAGEEYTKPVCTSPQPTVSEWEQSYEYATSSLRKYKIRKQGDYAITLHAKCTIKLNKESFTQLLSQYVNRSWATFDAYKSFQKQVFVLQKTDGRWVCSCYDFGLQHYCCHQHSVLWRYEGGENGINFPTACRRSEVLNFCRRGKGRPSKVPSALERLPPVIPEDDVSSDDFE